MPTQSTVLAIALALPSVLPNIGRADKPASQRNTKSLPADLQPWWQTFKSDLQNNVAAIRDSQFRTRYTHEYKSRRIIQMLERQVPIVMRVMNPGPKQRLPSPASFRAWLQTFVDKELEAFLSSVIEVTPAAHRGLIINRYAQRSAPKIELASLGRGRVAYISITFRQLTVDPVLLDSYEKIRLFLCHEFVHYLVEPPYRAHSPEETEMYLQEGMTEYMVIAAFENLGWVRDPRTVIYPDEVMVIGILMPLAHPILFNWYMRDQSQPTQVHSDIAKHLVGIGVDKQSADLFIADCQKKYRVAASLTFDKLLSPPRGMREALVQRHKALRGRHDSRYARAVAIRNAQRQVNAMQSAWINQIITTYAENVEILGGMHLRLLKLLDDAHIDTAAYQRLAHAPLIIQHQIPLSLALLPIE